MSSYDAVAEFYDAGRIGYSNELYNTLVSYGFSPRHRVLDVACGTGLASAPLIENGFRVSGIDISEAMIAKARERLPAGSWSVARAEALPFAEHTFDAAISAQAFHHVDRSTAIDELLRVVRPGGIVAIWWKVLMGQDRTKQIRDEVARELGVDPPQSGLSGGFKEFYGSRLTEQTLRVIPWHVTVPLANYMQYERSRTVVLDAFGLQADAYFARLEQRLREQFGGDNPPMPLGYIQFLYLARTPHV
jgi:ubiquinone/menaquinone biosynthesis C-methylase UbiE